MRSFLPLPLPRMRIHIICARLTLMLGARFELASPNGEGILSPDIGPNIKRQRGRAPAVGRMEAQSHPTPHYHFRYHRPDPYADSNIFLIWKWVA